MVMAQILPLSPLGEMLVIMALATHSLLNHLILITTVVQENHHEKVDHLLDIIHIAVHHLIDHSVFIS